MTESIRQQLIGKIDTRFKAIKTTAGYRTNIGNNVFDWLDRDLAEKELDALIYRDRANDIEAETLELRDNRMRLEIEIKTKAAGATAARVREMIADVYQAIGTDDTWDGLAINSEPVSEEMEIRQGDKITGGATLTIEIEYRAPKWEY